MDQPPKKTAFYLKYRPQSLADLVGQIQVKKTLEGAFAQNKLSHAYLFVGPRGTGKTSTARILAKMINCSAEQNVPCNKCQMCLSITDGSNLDLIEIDAASNRGIEDIRMLREKIKFSPTSAKKKVYIIDEVHMLTTEAFNALLKTLEEPPSHAVFILATTDVGKMPQTIMSRVQRLDFKPASPLELEDVLKKIVSLEKINIDKEVLKLLVKKSEGSFRDGVKLLDQLSSVGGEITPEVLKNSLRSTDFEDILGLLTIFIQKDPASALSWVLKQTEAEFDSKELILNLMETLRNLMFIKHSLGEQMVKPYLLEEKYPKLEKISKQFNTSEIIRDLDILQEALEKIKFTNIPSLPLELAVVKICSEEQKIQKKTEEFKIDSDSDIISLPSVEVADTPDSGSPDISKIKEKWQFVLETIRPYNFSLEALLRSISVTACTETTLVMEVPYSFHQRILEAPKNRDLLESIFSEILGRNIRLSTILGNRPQRREDIANIEVAADDEIIKAAAEIFNSDTIN